MAVQLTNLLKAINDLMKEVAYVQKDKENSFHRYKYAGEESLLDVLRPAMVRHGLILVPSMDSIFPIDEHGNSTIVMAYTLAHVSGEMWPHPIKVPGCGNDRNKQGGVGDKGVYKALTGANKYLLFKLFQIATGDDPEVANNVDDNSADNLRPGPVKPPPNQNYPREKQAYHFANPHTGEITPIAYGSGFLTQLEGKMNADDEDPVAWWSVNGPTAKLIAERHPQAQARVDAMEALANAAAEETPTAGP